MKRSVLAATSIVAALVLAGCSSGAGESTEEPTETTGAPETTSLTLGLIPIADYALPYIAQDEGYFEEEGLTVTFETMPNAAAIVPGVLNGQIQIGGAAMSPIISAVAEGLPLQIIAGAADTPASADAEISGLIVKPDSGIKSAKDMEGKVIAVNALGAAAELTAREVIDKDGGDPSTVTFVAMPFPEMTAALDRGDIDVAWLIEPFFSPTAKAGLVSAANPLFDGFVPGTNHAVYFASKQFVAENPNTIAAYDRAIKRAAEAVSSDPDLVRGVLQKYGNVPAEAAAAIKLGTYSGELSNEAAEHMIKIMEKHGFLEKGTITVEEIYVK